MRLLVAAAGVGAPAVWAAAHLRFMKTSGWMPSALEPQRFGALSARSADGPTGDTADAVVLLHGLISTGDVFGTEYDRLAAIGRLVIPDLLGFGRSLDEHRACFQPEAHLDALDDLARRAGLFDCPRWTLGAHSMGSSLALLWAARHSDRVGRVVCWGAPMYDSPAAARRRVAGSAMARLFALDTDLSARACAISCRHRTLAGWLSAIAEPRLPVSVARAAPLHTWPAYRDAIHHLVLEFDWARRVAECDQRGIDVHLIWGARDRIGDRNHARLIAAATTGSTIDVLPSGDHRLPLTHPEACIAQLLGTGR